MRKNKSKFVKILYKDKFIKDAKKIKNIDSSLNNGRLDSFRLK